MTLVSVKPMNFHSWLNLYRLRITYFIYLPEPWFTREQSLLWTHLYLWLNPHRLITVYLIYLPETNVTKHLSLLRRSMYLTNSVEGIFHPWFIKIMISQHAISINFTDLMIWRLIIRRKAPMTPDSTIILYPSSLRISLFFVKIIQMPKDAEGIIYILLC